MATTGIVNGHYLRFFDGGVAIARATECTDANSFATLYDKFIDGTSCALTFTTGESGDDVYYATAYITSMELNAVNNENVTYSISFEFSGEVVRS